MMGSMNFSVATDDVHVSTVSTSTMGGSDDVAAHDVHVRGGQWHSGQGRRSAL